MQNGTQGRDVLRLTKALVCPWAEIGKYWPGKEAIRLQDSLLCPPKKKIIVISTAVFFLSFLFQEHTKFKQVYQKAVYCRALNKSLPLYHNAKRIGYISFTIYICVIFLSFEKTSFSDHFKYFNTLTSFNSDKILNSFPILLLFKGWIFPR